MIRFNFFQCSTTTTAGGGGGYYGGGGGSYGANDARGEAIR